MKSYPTMRDKHGQNEHVEKRIGQGSPIFTCEYPMGKEGPSNPPSVWYGDQQKLPVAFHHPPFRIDKEHIREMLVQHLAYVGYMATSVSMSEGYSLGRVITTGTQNITLEPRYDRDSKSQIGEWMYAFIAADEDGNAKAYYDTDPRHTDKTYARFPVGRIEAHNRRGSFSVRLFPPIDFTQHQLSIDGRAEEGPAHGVSLSARGEIEHEPEAPHEEPLVGEEETKEADSEPESEPESPEREEATRDDRLDLYAEEEESDDESDDESLPSPPRRTTRSRRR